MLWFKKSDATSEFQDLERYYQILKVGVEKNI